MSLTASQTARLAKLKARLVLAEAAYASILTAQEYSIAGRSKKMASLADIQKNIDSLEAQIARLEDSDGIQSVRPSFTPSGY